MSKNEVKLEIILYFAQKCKMQEERRQVENSKKIFLEYVRTAIFCVKMEENGSKN